MAQLNIKQIRGASQGSILFLGTNSVVTEDSNLKWSDLDSTLSINGSIKITDGGEQEGYVLTSDSDGLASWQPLPDVIFIEDDDEGTTLRINSGTLSGTYSSLLGGFNNEVSGEGALVTGGVYNTALSNYSTIGGGEENNATGEHSVISGGYGNTASGNASTIGGGAGNYVLEDFGFIGAGIDNIVTGYGSSILGGSNNLVSSSHSSIMGGEDNIATHSNVHILGSGITSVRQDTTYVNDLIITSLTQSVGDFVAIGDDGLLTFTSSPEGSKWSGVTAISRSSDVDVYGRFTVATTSFPNEAIFRIEGSAGELFTIVDSLTVSLFSVNDISGLPVFEVFDDSTILFGDYLAPGLLTTKYNSVSSGTSSLYSLPTLDYDGSWIEYTIRSGSNLRSGALMVVWSGTSSFTFTETSVGDIGDTSGVSFGFEFSGDDISLQSYVDSGTWIIKTIIRSI